MTGKHYRLDGALVRPDSKGYKSLLSLASFSPEEIDSRGPLCYIDAPRDLGRCRVVFVWQRLGYSTIERDQQQKGDRA